MARYKSLPALDPETVNEFLGNSSYGRLLAMIGQGKSVLDLGCGPGNLARLLSDAGNTVVGVDNDESSLAAASEFCERVVVADLRHGDLAETLGSADFDAVVLADVIEHVTNPVDLLQTAKGFIRPGGFLYASIPNVAHGAVRLALLRGNFAYTRLGLMDETHVRFYTRASIEELFSASGYRIVEMTRTTAPVFAESDLVPLVRRTDFSESVVADVERDPECETLQFIIRAEPVANVEGSGLVYERLSTALQDLRTLEARYAQLERGAAEDRAAYTRNLAALELENKRVGLELDRFRFDASASQDREILRLQTEITALEAELGQARQRRLDADVEISSLIESLKSARLAVDERDAYGRRVDSLEAALHNTEESLHDLSNACDDARRGVAEREIEIRDLTEKLLAVKAAQAATLGDLAAFQRRASESERAEERIVELERALAGRELHVSQMSRSIEEYVTAASALAEHQERLCAEISQIHQEITTMRASKFWRLRNLWFRLRRGRSR